MRQAKGKVTRQRAAATGHSCRLVATAISARCGLRLTRYSLITTTTNACATMRSSSLWRSVRHAPLR